MQFHTYFDARDPGLLDYGPLVIGATFVVVGLGVAILGAPKGRAPLGSPRVFGGLFAACAAAWLVFTALFISGRQAEIARILAQRDYQVVEGVVADFRPDPTFGGHGVERFRVGSTWLYYRGPVSTGGFHQLRADGGPITEGRRVRMAVDRRGRILRLDLAD